MHLESKDEENEVLGGKFVFSPGCRCLLNLPIPATVSPVSSG